MRIAFADESGTDNHSPCYAIGVISVESTRREAFERYLTELRAAHRFTGEAKWTRVRTSHGLTNFALASLDAILRSSTAEFDVIVVNKSLFRNWAIIGPESAFYQTYTYLLRHIVRRSSVSTEVLIDDRSDSYSKRHEVVETIGNHMLARLEQSGRLGAVRRVRSHDQIGVQVADLLTGAVNAAHLRHLLPQAPLNPGKALTIMRLAELIGWDNLCYDTFPSPRLNIWHFPTEYRAVPTSRAITPAPSARFVTPDEMKACQTSRSS